MNSSESKADTTAPLREIEFSETDTLLRDDVRRLGAMVGQMLAEQQSPEFLEKVESVRRMSIARRENDEAVDALAARLADRSEEHTSELQSLMRISYAVFCLKKKIKQHTQTN